MHDLPRAHRAARVVRASTSSGLFHAQSGQRYPSSGGEHIYLAVADAADVERFLHALHERAWLADVFARIAAIPQTRLHELLPWNWKRLNQAPAAAAAA
jgi:hypothetical protein